MTSRLLALWLALTACIPMARPAVDDAHVVVNISANSGKSPASYSVALCIKDEQTSKNLGRIFWGPGIESVSIRLPSNKNYLLLAYITDRESYSWELVAWKEFHVEKEPMDVTLSVPGRSLALTSEPGLFPNAWTDNPGNASGMWARVRQIDNKGSIDPHRRTWLTFFKNPDGSPLLEPFDYLQAGRYRIEFFEPRSKPDNLKILRVFEVDLTDEDFKKGSLTLTRTHEKPTTP